MKKLTKAEIQALTNKIVEEVMPEIDRKYEAKKNELIDAFYQTEVGVLIDAILQLNGGEFKDCINMGRVFQCAGVSIIDRSKFPSRYSINSIVIDNIILAQLDCEDLDTLISTVKESLLKQD